MDIFQLHLFCSLAHTLNYRKTADEHHITQPAVSYHIKNLEDELHIQLLERSKYCTALTVAGIEFLRYAERICEQEKLAKGRMESFASGEYGKLTIAGIQSYQTQISTAVSAYSSDHPDVSIELNILEGPELIHSYRFSEFDVYFGIESMLMEHPNYECKSVSRDYMELYYPAKLQPKPDSETWNKINGIPFISIAERNHTLYNRVRSIIQQCEYTPDQIHYSSSIEAVLHLINAGVGISILPAGYNTDGCFANVHSLPILHPDALLTLVISTRKNLNQPVISSFVKKIEHAMGARM